MIKKTVRTKYDIYNFLKQGFYQREIGDIIGIHRRAITYHVQEFIILGIMNDLTPNTNKYKKYEFPMPIESFYDFNQLYPKKNVVVIRHPNSIKALEKINSNKLHLSFKGRSHSEETRQYLREMSSSMTKKYSDTKPEKMMQIALSLRGIKYVKNKAIIGKPDLFIEPNIAIFLDGCYWHYCRIHNQKPPVEKQIKKIIRDSIVNKKLTKDGIFVIRMWEHDVLSDVDSCSLKIFNLINIIQNGTKMQNQLQVKF